MSLFSAESEIVEKIADKYPKDAPNMDVYLKGDSTNSLLVDRRYRSE
jgi:hypothetical protein